MSYIGSDLLVQDIAAANDRKNLDVINRAVADGRINDEAADYLKSLYSDSMHWFREVFYVLGDTAEPLVLYSLGVTPKCSLKSL